MFKVTDVLYYTGGYYFYITEFTDSDSTLYTNRYRLDEKYLMLKTLYDGKYYRVLLPLVCKNDFFKELYNEV